MSTTLELQALQEMQRRRVVVDQNSEFISYEQRLNQDSRWALSEGSVFFEDKGDLAD